jgi:hypothetical protein
MWKDILKARYSVVMSKVWQVSVRYSVPRYLPIGTYVWDLYGTCMGQFVVRTLHLEDLNV